jgi:hypothetical protein
VPGSLLLGDQPPEAPPLRRWEAGPGRPYQLRLGWYGGPGGRHWGNLWRRRHPEARPALALHPRPVPEPSDLAPWVNWPQTEAELPAVRRSVARGFPFGAPAWQGRTARRPGLELTPRPRGRPREAGAAPGPPGNGGGGALLPSSAFSGVGPGVRE